jgi:hypothetical protein
MKLEERRLIDQVLVAEEQCLGAVFCSYTFDPAYFEDHALRAVLRLRGDPEEDGVRYHEEARRALQDTPVACLVDASVRRPGRRLPYDLLLVRRRTFHPKVFLLLFESEARVAVGSGNLTKSGIEQNTEMFFVRRLRYDEPADAAFLRDVSTFFADCAALAGSPGTQLELVRAALGERVRQTPRVGPDQPVEFQFVSSFGGRVLDQLTGGIHELAKITRVGVLAPFFEQDDLEIGEVASGLGSVLSELAALRPASEMVMDVGVPWDDAPVAVPAGARLPMLDERLGSLWAWRKRTNVDGTWTERMEFFVVTATAQKRIDAIDSAGEPCRFDRETLERQVLEGRLWRVAKLTVFAPKSILRHIAAERTVRLWLHPTSELTSSGRIRRRPLHAKIILVTAKHRGRALTYALIGSANASRGALTRAVSQAGNVEACVLCRFDGEVSIHDMLPTLVSYDLDGVELSEREAPKATIDLSAWIDDVVHDAAARTLSVIWRTEGPAPLGPWSLRYLDREFLSGDDAPQGVSEVAQFDLDPASAEVTFASQGCEWQLPIRVADLAALPTNPLLASLGLRELLALLGRRVGAERLATLRGQRGATGVASVLDAVFGEGFGPTDVFKAWWGGLDDLRSAATVSAFRHRLVGPTGLTTTWQALREVPSEVLSKDEIWVYGCELLKELRRLELPPAPDAKAKRKLLGGAISALQEDLDRLAPSAEQHPWMSVVSRFYGMGARDAGA